MVDLHLLFRHMDIHCSAEVCLVSYRLAGESGNGDLHVQEKYKICGLNRLKNVCSQLV